MELYDSWILFHTTKRNAGGVCQAGAAEEHRTTPINYAARIRGESSPAYMKSGCRQINSFKNVMKQTVFTHRFSLELRFISLPLKKIQVLILCDEIIKILE